MHFNVVEFKEYAYRNDKQSLCLRLTLWMVGEYLLMIFNSENPLHSYTWTLKKRTHSYT